MTAARKRGRPRIHLDDAARSAAHRERVADQLALLHMYQTVFARPRPPLFEDLAKKIAIEATDKASIAVLTIKAVLDGLNAGAGANCVEAAVNFVKYEYRSNGQ